MKFLEELDFLEGCEPYFCGVSGGNYLTFGDDFRSGAKLIFETGFLMWILGCDLDSDLIFGMCELTLVTSIWRVGCGSALQYF